MEESFEMQSSMSPKVKGQQRHYRKGTTLLALKKNIRKSSVYDKSYHTINNDELIIIEDSNATDSSPSNSGRQLKIVNKSPILISDTEYSENENESNQTSLREDKILVNTIEETSTRRNKSLLSKDKLYDIEQWIDRVNTENEIKPNITAYSELSTIYGDAFSPNFKAEGVGHAVNSTFVEPSCIPFDKLFKDKENIKPNDVPVEPVSSTMNKDNQSFSDIVIENSFESLNTKLQKNIVNNKPINEGTRTVFNNFVELIKPDVESRPEQKHINISNRNSTIISNELNDSINLIKSEKKSSVEPKNMDNMSNKQVHNPEHVGNNIETDESRHDLVSLLDDLYGNSWREKEEHVLPRTEPRKKLPKPNLYIANTERKPKFSVLYKNPYAESEKIKSTNLLQNLQRSRIQLNFESPWSKRLNNLCDSDTPSEDSSKANKFRKKLDFEDDSDSDADNDKLNNDQLSKYFKHSLDIGCKVQSETESNDNLDKDISYLGASLEERIKKKIDKTYVPKTNSKIPKKQITNSKKPLKEKKGASFKNGIENFSSTSESNTSESSKTEKSDKRNPSPLVSSDDEWDKEVGKISHECKLVNGKFSFLASLSANVPILKCDMSARIYRSSFKNYKDQLLEKLFNLYNEKVFENALPKDTEFEWNDRLRGTAGYCSCKKITRRTGAVERKVKIVLSTKVIDAAYRLRDTLIHELCHAATWIVNCVSDGHGSYWKSWAYRAMKIFPELPPIKRCHDYVIHTKYTYKCTGCGYSIGRHSKSLDIERKRCGYCRGKFEIILNKVGKKGETKSVPATPKREATGFALFVKENYAIYKNAQLKHGDLMKLLGQKFQEMKMK